ncbi:short chain dehydrogenase [seawater metagenome]|uniref:Short chain dehydrogenase n=1 Tax=seawater metagenome TaxID=1561972 RepID=A0A5E8CJR2_9ZZZZ
MKILITGGTSGIGLSFVKFFHLEHDITVVCRNQDKGEQLKGFYNIKVLYVDLSDYNQIMECFYKLDTDFDILINNAGMSATRKTVDFKNRKINKCLMVNLIAPYLFTEYMCKNKSLKKVISVNSITHWVGELPTIDDSVNNCYSNSKFGLMALHENWNKKYPETKFISINPGYVDTGIWNPNASYENIHYYLRKVFSLKPDDSISVFRGALNYEGDEPIYLSVNKNSELFLYLANKFSYKFMLANDFLGKLFLYSKVAEVNTKYSESIKEDNVKKVVDFCNNLIN